MHIGLDATYEKRTRKKQTDPAFRCYTAIPAFRRAAALAASWMVTHATGEHTEQTKGILKREVYAEIGLLRRYRSREVSSRSTYSSYIWYARSRKTKKTGSCSGG